MRIELDGDQLGKALADSDDTAQAEALNEFGRFLKMSCRDSLRLEKQFCYIADKLDSDGRHLVTELAAFIAISGTTEQGKG